jgi:polysaccharide biosynthesis transport protein
MNMKKTNKDPEDSIDLKTLWHLFLKRKWWFIGTFIIVLVLGMLYMWNKPVIYEVRYKFTFEDDLRPDDYLIYSDTQELYTNESVFIQARDVEKIFESDIIFSSLMDIDEIGDDYQDYFSSSLQELDLVSDTGLFYLDIRNKDRELADEVARNLIESLDVQVMNDDIEIYENTMAMIEGDIARLQEEIDSYEEKISSIEEEIAVLNDSTDIIDYEVMEKKGEILLYRSKIIDNEDQIDRLDGLYKAFEDERSQVLSRVEIIEADPDYDVENDRLMNSLIVILLSLLTAIVVVLAVNYIYKLKET